MELKIDLLDIENKSTFRIILGIGFLVLSAAWIITKTAQHQNPGFIGWLFISAMIFNGFSHTIGGMGYSINKLFGQAFIEIDEQQIAIKTGVWDKEQRVAWKNIKSMEYLANKYCIRLNDGKLVIIQFSNLDYLLKMNIKDVIISLAAEKGITIG